MANPYHDETGKFCSSDEMGAAVDRLAAEGKFEEAYALAKEHTAASRAEMDATLSEMKEFGVPVSAATAPAKASAGGSTTTQANPRRPLGTEKQKRETVAKVFNTFALPKNHTYKPAGVTPGEGTNYYDRKFTGNKSGGYRSVTEIAKDVRADLAEAQAKGYLPKGLKFSVTGEKYSGGQSMNVKIQGGKDKDLFITGDENTRPEWGNNVYTDEATEVRKRVQGIVDAYRWDESDAQWDYFSTNFYGHVDIETERSAKWREGQAEEARVKREGYKHRKEMVTKVEADADKVFATSATPKTTKDGSGSFGFVPGTKILLVQGTSTNPFNKRSVDVKEMYDLTSYTVKGGGSLEDVVASQDFFDLRSNLSKNKFYPAKVARGRR